MKKARVKLTWTLSASPDVVTQELVVSIFTSGNPTPTNLNFTLQPNIREQIVEIEEKKSVTVRLTVTDGVNTSDPATLTFNIGDLEKPAAPTGLAYEILEIITVP